MKAKVGKLHFTRMKNDASGETGEMGCEGFLANGEWEMRWG